ncbi:MAG: ABC transporter ATP-binding protein [Alphaproteobacteria bacterium]|nr:ABC transporter ATP-binding protein [Alphaproteobacteria bacterium]
MHELLRINDLTVEFDLPNGKLRAVDGVSFRVPRGRIVALVGESGSGKTVIGQSIMGLLPRNARILGGEILFDHDEDEATPRIDVAQLARRGAPLRALRGRYMSIIFQEPMSALSPVHRIGDQVSENLSRHLRLSAKERRARTIDMLRLSGFPDPERAYRAYPFELSGGLRQRAMIAMALINRPSLLIADEPTTALDVTIQAQILLLLQNLQQQLRMAVLMITHDLGVVANIADEVVVLHDGKLVEAGCREDIFRRPGHPYLRDLMAAAPRLSGAPAHRTPPASAPALLEVKGLYKTYAGHGKNGSGEVAVADVSFTVPRGQCVALVGESGSGKTTLGRLILRATLPDAGAVRFDGEDVLAMRGAALLRYRRRAQYIFQDPHSSLNPRMTILETLREPLIIHRIGTRVSQTARARELMRLVGLEPQHLARYPNAFSGGQRQRIVIARALALGPELLVCDEPVSALDVPVQAQIIRLLKELQDSLGLTYLFISHNLAVVREIADHILVMRGGRIVEQAAAEDLFAHPAHPYTRALLAAVPKPDLDARLDFQRLAAERPAGPPEWPQPYRLLRGDGGTMIELTRGHSVRVGAPAS